MSVAQIIGRPKHEGLEGYNMLNVIFKGPFCEELQWRLWIESGFEVRSAAWPSALGCQGRAMITLSARMLPRRTSLYVSFPYSWRILPPQYSNKLLKTNEEGHYALRWKSCCYVAWEPFTIKMKHIPEPFRSVFFPIFFFLPRGWDECCSSLRPWRCCPDLSKSAHHIRSVLALRFGKAPVLCVVCSKKKPNISWIQGTCTEPAYPSKHSGLAWPALLIRYSAHSH